MNTAHGTTHSDRSKFEVAIICALETESTAVEASFDEVYDASLYGHALGDTNAYTLGRIGEHHVVLVYLPSIGKASSASAAAGLRTSFSSIRLSLLVGICGGAPSRQEQGSEVEIFLGDIIIGTGVVQYDLGRQYDGGRSVRRNTVHDNMSRLPPEIRSLLHKSQAGLGRRNMQEKALLYINSIHCKDEFATWAQPALDEDILYPAEFVHRHRLLDYCADCEAPGGMTCSGARQATCEELRCAEGSKVLRARHTHR